MNRKLHNTVMAMIASSSLFVLGLLTASPALSPTPAAAASNPWRCPSFPLLPGAES